MDLCKPVNLRFWGPVTRGPGLDPAVLCLQGAVMAPSRLAPRALNTLGKASIHPEGLAVCDAPNCLILYK